MKAFLTFAGFLLLAGNVKSAAADTVALNGITSLFGQSSAFLVLYQSAQSQPITFSLSEGEARFGVKLIAVDMSSHRAQIERNGLKEYLHLMSAPNLSGAGNLAQVIDDNSSKSSPAAQAEVLRFLSQNQEVKKVQAGNPSIASANSRNLDSSPIDHAGQSAIDSASNFASQSSTDFTQAGWYQDSLNIEQNRIATAQQVLSGEMSPWPLTPLTPAGTPAVLVGKDTLYSSHIPHFVDRSSVDSLASVN